MEFGLFEDEVAMQQIRVLRKNERVWSKLLHRAQGLEKALPFRDLSLNAVVLPLMDNNQKKNQWAGRVEKTIRLPKSNDVIGIVSQVLYKKPDTFRITSLLR